MDRPEQQSYYFGPFRLDPAERLLLRDGVPVPLAPKVFDTLVVLVRHGGHLIGKEQLLREVWPDSFVEEVNLSVNISALRKALGDDPHGPVYIETVPKRGYRFVAAPARPAADGGAELFVEHRLRARIVTEETETDDAADGVASPRRARAAGSGDSAAGVWPRRKILAIGLAVSLLAAAAVGLSVRGRRAPAPFDVRSVTLQRLTSAGNAAGAALSPDGQFVVYNASDEESRVALWLRHVGGREAMQLVPPTHDAIWGFAVSHDNNWVYYVQTDPDAPLRGGTIYRVPVLGGSPRKLTEGVYSNISLSPDDRRVVFDRFTDTNCYMLTADAVEGGDERLIGTSDSARNFLNPQWSPDGTKILFFDIEERADGFYWSLAEVPAEGGAIRTVLAPRRQKIWFMAWADGGRGIVLNATDPATKLPQLYYVSYPDGETRHITNDLLYYNGVSVSGDRVVTSLKERPTKVWVTPWPDPQPARQLAGDGDLCDALSWTPDGRIVYDTSDDGRYHIWIMDGDGRRRQQLSPDRVEDRLPDISPDGSHIAFLSNRSGAWALWLMDADGSGARQLTPGGGIWSPRFAPDGQSVYFEMEQGTQNYIARIPIKGGNPEVLVGGLSSYTLYDVSPDGRQLAYSFPDKELQRMRVAVRPVGGGAPEAYFDIDPGYFLRWTPDGKGLAYAQEREDHKAGSAIWVQPLAGGPPQQLIGFEQDLVIYAAWSRDARQLAFGRGRLLSDIVLLSRAKAQP